MMLEGTEYVGRFAPSPTGPLHIGSLIAAVASYLDAKHHRGRWLVRIEDLDLPRTSPEADQSILTTLLAHGLQWDSPPQWQSQRDQYYAASLARLQGAGLCYTCDCTRARLVSTGGTYDGRCRTRRLEDGTNIAIRVQVDNTPITFKDAIQGQQSECLCDTIGDFIIRRKDGIFAYQLAVVVDDADQQISHVVRGADLLDSTGRQIYLQQLLGLPTPQYAHFPVAGDNKGQKLSKQNHAKAVDDSKATSNLRAALAFLRQPAPPVHLMQPEALLQWSTNRWQRNAIEPALLLTRQ